MESPRGGVFVLMPSGERQEYPGGPEESRHVFEAIIKPGVHGALGTDCTVTRAIDENKAGLITASILWQIAYSEVVIVDITGWNPNVFFELGIRFALRKKATIVLAQEGTSIPFDIAAYRVVFYNRLRPEEAHRKITECVRHGVSSACVSDSLVFDILDHSVHIDLVDEGADRATGRAMGWDEFIRRVRWAADWMRPRVDDGGYRPDAVLGISNGGLVVADLLGKAVFARTGTPILSLWAQRVTASTEYFENAYNHALTAAIRGEKDPAGTLELLVVDDHFGTGITALQAATYLKKRLGDDTRILFLPIATARLDNVFRLEHLLAFNYTGANGEPVFDVTREQFLSAIHTDAAILPFRTRVNRRTH